MELKRINRARFFRLLGFATLVLSCLAACSPSPKEFRFVPPEHQAIDPAALQNIFEERSGVRMVKAQIEPGMSGLEALIADQADMAVVENINSFKPGVRAVLPVYQSVLHLLVRDGLKPENPDKPLENALIYVVDNSNAAHLVLSVFAKRQGLSLNEYQVVTEHSPEVDIILYFGPINPDNSGWYVPGYTLVSLDSSLNPQREFSEDGVGYIVPNMYAKVIPALAYELPGNEGPIATVASDTLLIVKADLGIGRVYELTKTLVEQKSRFTAVAPHIFTGITESFDPLDLNFPLHSGARRYLNRDEPGLVERYAESINLLLYMLFLLLSAAVALVRWGMRKKKNRIDTFYIRALAIKKRAIMTSAPELLSELNVLEQEAYDALVDEKLAPNESFRIFTDLLNQIRRNVKSEMRS
jgi:hypothetical protein